MAVSIGHVSQTTPELCSSRCFSNFFLDSKTESHFEQYTLVTLFFEVLSTTSFYSQSL